MLSRKKESKFKISGRISEGLGEGATFIKIPWVRRQFMDRLGIDPYPGTLNLKILNEDDLRKFKTLKTSEGIEILPEEPSFCKGKCYPVLINGKLRGAIIIPDVKNYPENKIEIIAQENIKETLNVKEGDLLEIETY